MSLLQVVVLACQFQSSNPVTNAQIMPIQAYKEIADITFQKQAECRKKIIDCASTNSQLNDERKLTECLGK